MLRIDLKLLSQQYDAIVNSNIKKKYKEGLLNLLSSIEHELKQEDEVIIVTEWE